MSWYKLAKAFTDEQAWVLHGISPQACRDEFKARHAERDLARREAEKISESLGHKLGPWGSNNSNRCRKCGTNCILPNIDGKIDVKNFIDGYGGSMVGGAATQPCFSHLDVPKDYWIKSDEEYEVYKDSETSL